MIKRKITVILSVFLAAFFLSSPYLLAKPNRANPAPNFKLQDLNQVEVSLSDYKDQPVILFFWTTWCPYCQKELQVLKGMSANLSRDNITVLAIDVGELPNKVKAAVEKYHLAYRVLLDKDTSVADKFQIVGVPTYVIVNRQGNIVFKDNYFPPGYRELVAD